MKEIRYKDEEYYKQLLDEIYNNKPLSNCPELEVYRKNLKILFSQFLIDEEIDNSYLYWTHYIDMAIELSKEVGDTIISQRLIDKLLYLVPNPGECELLSIIETVYVPRLTDFFQTYLKNCKWLYDLFLFHVQEEADVIVNVHELDNFYQYMGYLKVPGIKPNSIWSEGGMISLIFAYLHYHQIYDYELIEEYLKNIDYYNNKMNLNGCYPIIKNKYNEDEYDFNKASILFDNLEKFFVKEENKIIIK